jgi:predicted DNA-binding ribbon-helix-helix protein
LPTEELEMHFKAMMAAKSAMHAPEQSAPPALPAPEMAPAPAMKSEKSDFMKMSKAQDTEIESLKALIKAQAEDTDNLSKALKLIIEQPVRKAITGVSHLAKTEVEKAPLTRAGLDAKLKKIAQNPSLNKSERELINDFYDKRVGADSLASLFEDYK